MMNLWKILRFGGPYFRPYLSRLILGIVMGIIFGLANGALVWATKTLIERMSPPPTALQAQILAEQTGGRAQRARAYVEEKTDLLFDAWLPSAGRKISLQHVIGGVLLFPLLVGIRGFIGYFSSYFMGWTSERVVNDMRVSVLRKITGLSLAFFDRAKTGDLLTRINGDTTALQRCFSVGFSDLIKEPVTILGVLTALCLIDWQLTLGSLVIFPICILPIMILGQKVRRAGRATVEVAVLQSSQLVEMFSGIRVIKAFGLEAAQVERFRRLSKELVSHTMRGLRAKEQINPIIETVAMFGFGLLILYIAYQGRQVSDMVSFLTGLVFLYTPVKKLASMHAMFEQSRAGIERLVDILNQKTTVLEPSHPRPLQNFHDAIEFKSVNFSYDRQPVLEDLNLRLARGSKLGVAGESGSGKSTLVNLVLRYYDPTSGSIRLDGTDIRDVATQDLRKLMALVSQEIVLFDLTVAENIACGRPNATRQEIEEAARSAHAHEFIMRLPHGYDTWIGERGVTLSGGQRQRLAIARAFVRNAPILILDEATASLDSQAEREVQAAIDRLAENRTVICIAHRLSTLANMDQILVLERGRVVEQGTFEELLSTEGPFAAMASRQGLLGRAATESFAVKPA